MREITIRPARVLGRALGVALAVTLVTSGLTGWSQAASAESDPALGPYLLLPSWGDLPGGRVVLPDGSAALTFPDDWGAVALTDDRKAEVLLADPNAEQGMGLTTLEVMAETIGVDPHEQCLLSVFPLPAERTVEDIVPSVAESIGPDVTVEPTDLPAGPAIRLGYSFPVTNPERFDGTRELTNSMFLIGHGGRILVLVCSGFQPPEDQWLSIASTVEWTGPASSSPSV